MRDHKLYLEDMLEAANRIERYLKGMTIGKLRKDTLVLDGIVRNLEIVGEAAKNIPSPIKNKYPEVEWKKIAGLRDVLAHEYFGIDLEVVWDIVKNKLPSLREKIKTILKRKNSR